MTFSDIRTEAQLFNKDADLATGGTNEAYWLTWINRVIRVISSQLELPDMIVREKLKLPKWHAVPDTTNVFTLNPVNPEEPNALSKCIAGANAFKTLFNAHLASTTVHAVADAANVISAAASTDLATLLTLLDEADGDWNAHLVQSTVHTDNDYNNGITEFAHTTLAHCCETYNALRKAYIEHIVDYPRYLWLPPDMDEVLTCRFSSDTFYLDKISYDDLRSLDPDLNTNQVGDVNYYSVYGSRLYFWKRTTEYLHIEYKRQPKLLVATTDIPDGIPANFHWVLIHGILAISYKYSKEPDLRKEELESFNAGVDAMRKYINRTSNMNTGLKGAYDV